MSSSEIIVLTEYEYICKEYSINMLFHTQQFSELPDVTSAFQIPKHQKSIDQLLKYLATAVGPIMEDDCGNSQSNEEQTNHSDCKQNVKKVTLVSVLFSIYILYNNFTH
jgi:hypothetical protein